MHEYEIRHEPEEPLKNQVSTFTEHSKRYLWVSPNSQIIQRNLYALLKKTGEIKANLVKAYMVSTPHQSNLNLHRDNNYTLIYCLAKRAGDFPPRLEIRYCPEKWFPRPGGAWMVANITNGINNPVTSMRGFSLQDFAYLSTHVTLLATDDRPLEAQDEGGVTRNFFASLADAFFGFVKDTPDEIPEDLQLSHPQMENIGIGDMNQCFGNNVIFPSATTTPYEINCPHPDQPIPGTWHPRVENYANIYQLFGKTLFAKTLASIPLPIAVPEFVYAYLQNPYHVEPTTFLDQFFLIPRNDQSVIQFCVTIAQKLAVATNGQKDAFIAAIQRIIGFEIDPRDPIFLAPTTTADSEVYRLISSLNVIDLPREFPRGDEDVTTLVIRPIAKFIEIIFRLFDELPPGTNRTNIVTLFCNKTAAYIAANLPFPKYGRALASIRSGFSDQAPDPGQAGTTRRTLQFKTQALHFFENGALPFLRQAHVEALHSIHIPTINLFDLIESIGTTHEPFYITDPNVTLALAKSMFSFLTSSDLVVYFQYEVTPDLVQKLIDNLSAIGDEKMRHPELVTIETAFKDFFQDIKRILENHRSTPVERNTAQRKFNLFVSSVAGTSVYGGQKITIKYVTDQHQHAHIWYHAHTCSYQIDAQVNLDYRGPRGFALWAQDEATIKNHVKEQLNHFIEHAAEDIIAAV